MIVTDFYCHIDRFGEFIKRNPIAACRDEFVAVQGCAVAYHDTVVFRVQFHHIHWFGSGNSQATALADSVKFDAVVMAEDLAAHIHNFAPMFLHEICLLKESAVIVVGHETDFHAFLFVGGLEVAMAGDGAGVAFGLFAERKHRACQLVLPEREKEITLVLARIASALEQAARTVFARLDAGEMSGGDEVGAKLVRTINEPAELEILVAHHTRIGRAAGPIFIRKILDDVLLKFPGFINEVIRDA